MKKIFAIALPALMLLLTAGCWSKVELENRAIVSGVAIDRGEGGLLEVSAQVIKPGEVKTGTSAGGGVSRPPVMILSADGNTVFEAIREIASKSGRKLFWGQSQVLIIGEEAARNGIDDILDFFNRDAEPRRRAFIAVTQGKAKDLLYADFNMAKIPAYGIADVIEGSSVNSRAAVVRIQDYARDISEPSSKPLTSRLALYEDKQGKKGVMSSGAGVFSEYRLIGFLNEEETRGYLWVTGKVKGGIVSAPVEEDKRVAMEVLKATGRITPELHGGGVKVKISVDVVGNIAEVQDKKLDINDPKVIPELEMRLSETVSREVWSAISRARDLDADIFGFGEKVRRKYPRQWKDYSSRWDALFLSAPVEVAVNVELKRTGKIINPAHAVLGAIEAGRKQRPI